MDFKVKYKILWKVKQSRDKKTITSHKLQSTQFGQSIKEIKSVIYGGVGNQRKQKVK